MNRASYNVESSRNLNHSVVVSESLKFVRSGNKRKTGLFSKRSSNVLSKSDSGI